MPTFPSQFSWLAFFALVNDCDLASGYKQRSQTSFPALIGKGEATEVANSLSARFVLSPLLILFSPWLCVSGKWLFPAMRCKTVLAVWVRDLILAFRFGMLFQ